MVDTVVMFMAKAELFMYVDPSNYWLFRPKQGPFTTKIFTGRTPVISVRTSKRFATTRFRYPQLSIKKILMNNWGYLNLVVTNLLDSSHVDDWSSPGKEFGGKKTLLWSDESRLGGRGVHLGIHSDPVRIYSRRVFGIKDYSSIQIFTNFSSDLCGSVSVQITIIFKKLKFIKSHKI